MVTVGRIDRVVKRKGKVITADQGASTAEAAELMSEHQVGAVVVVNDVRQMVGILTERDIINHVVAAARSPADTKVHELMTRHVVACKLSTSIADARSLMAKYGIRHLPIVEDGVPLGMISSRDILSHELETTRALVERQGAVLSDLEKSYPGITRLEVSADGRIVI